MRPVRRGPSPRESDFADYSDARPELRDRLGDYCSYCERRLSHAVHVEHIVSRDQDPALVGRWENFLLACANCNGTKGRRSIHLPEVLLPDRDNTFLAFDYLPNGTVCVREDLSPDAACAAGNTLHVVGLGATPPASADLNGQLVATDRRAQRQEAWQMATNARQTLRQHPDCWSVVVDLARSLGFFSVWMAVFHDDIEMRERLILAFPGTWESGCFSADTTAPISPAPNPDQLPAGGKL